MNTVHNGAGCLPATGKRILVMSYVVLWLFLVGAAQSATGQAEMVQGEIGQDVQLHMTLQPEVGATSPTISAATVIWKGHTYQPQPFDGEKWRSFLKPDQGKNRVVRAATEPFISSHDGKALLFHWQWRQRETGSHRPALHLMRCVLLESGNAVVFDEVQ